MNMSQKIVRPDLKRATDARAVRTRDALRQALLALLDRKALDEITIRDICALANVGYTTFFRHYPTKESLLGELAQEQMRQLVELAQAVTAISDTRSGARALCNYVDQHRTLWATLLTGGAAGVMRDEFMRLSQEVASTRIATDAWPPADLAAILVVSSTIELLTWWLRSEHPLSAEQVADILETTIIMPTVKATPKAAAASPP
jgi:AcrR family transcriptional regulator